MKPITYLESPERRHQKSPIIFTYKGTWGYPKISWVFKFMFYKWGFWNYEYNYVLNVSIIFNLVFRPTSKRFDILYMYMHVFQKGDILRAWIIWNPSLDVNLFWMCIWCKLFENILKSMTWNIWELIWFWLENERVICVETCWIQWLNEKNNVILMACKSGMTIPYRIWYVIESDKIWMHWFYMR